MSVKRTVLVWLALVALVAIVAEVLNCTRTPLAVLTVLNLLIVERLVLLGFATKLYSRKYQNIWDLKLRIIQLEKETWELKRENAGLHLSYSKLERQSEDSQQLCTR
jgi:hypothetical protein